MSSTLIVVDVQKDFVEGGSLAVDGGLRLARKIAEQLPDWKEEFTYVVATKDWHIDPGGHWSDDPDFVSSWPVHCRAGSDGADYAGHLLSDEDFDSVFKKGEYEAAYSGFEGKNEDGILLGDWLKEREVTQVTVIGIAYDYCVAATAASAATLGLDTVVLSQYAASVNNNNNEMVVTILDQVGVTVL